MVPVGYLIAALSPEYRLVGLHTVFIGGFTMGLLSYALYWVINKDNVLRRRFDRAVPAGMFSGFLVISLLLRSLSEASDSARIISWGCAAIAYIMGVLLWIYLMMKALRLRKIPALPH
jgi:drug/metabolite transporter (DMT)-like permease